jgi:hypothetical protein
MLQQDGMVMKMMKVLVMMVMIPMKSSSMRMMMATISPLREGISSVDFSLPKSFLSLCVTTQDFIIFWGKFFVFVLLEMIGISQGFKTF